MGNIIKDGLISIGKMAKINRISVPALRLYDEMGLLTPRYTDPDTGYRYYDLQQSARLDMIAYMKELGMQLSEIRDIFLSEDIALIEEKLIEKNEMIHQQMRDLKAQHDAVQRTIASIERYRKSPVTGTLSLEYIDRRYIWSIPCRNFYEGDISDFESALSALRSALIKHSVKHVHSYNVGTSIVQSDFENGVFKAADVFIFGDKQLTNYGGNVSILESGMYACIYLDKYDDEPSCAGALLRYCKENGYKISGNYICEVMTEFNIFDSTQRNMFIRLQVLVSFR